MNSKLRLNKIHSNLYIKIKNLRKLEMLQMTIFNFSLVTNIAEK